MLRVIAAVAVVAILVLWGSDGSASDEAKVRLAFAALIVLAFPVMYLYHFVRAPAILDAQRQEEIDRLRGTEMPQKTPSQALEVALKRAKDVT